MKIVYADTNKYDDKYRIILTTLGTWRDLDKHRIVLQNGLKLTFYMDDADANGNEDCLIFDGVTHYDELNSRWVAEIYWKNFKHMSDFSIAERELLGEIQS